jgi:hypothetical protein
VLAAPGEMPDHFCQVSLEEAKAKCSSIKVNLEAGQTLYLPSGYLHHVESHCQEASAYHCAINWWFFPPDVEDYEKPYSTVAWY